MQFFIWIWNQHTILSLLIPYMIFLKQTIAKGIIALFVNLRAKARWTKMFNHFVWTCRRITFDEYSIPGHPNEVVTTVAPYCRYGTYSTMLTRNSLSLAPKHTRSTFLMVFQYAEWIPIILRPIEGVHLPPGEAFLMFFSELFWKGPGPNQTRRFIKCSQKFVCNRKEVACTVLSLKWEICSLEVVWGESESCFLTILQYMEGWEAGKLSSSFIFHTFRLCKFSCTKNKYLKGKWAGLTWIPIGVFIRGAHYFNHYSLTMII